MTKRTFAALAAALMMMSATAAVAQPDADEPPDAGCVWLAAERDRKVARADYYKAEDRLLGRVELDPKGLGYEPKTIDGKPDGELERDTRSLTQTRRSLLLAERRDAFKKFYEAEADERTARKSLLKERPDINRRDLDDYFGNVLKDIRDRCDNGNAGR